MSTPTKRRPDALRVPREALKLRPSEDPDVKLKALYAPVLGSRVVYRRDLHDGREKLLLPSADVSRTSLFFPTGHPLQGQDRYHWFVAKKLVDGTLAPELPYTGASGQQGKILLGYLQEDPHADDPQVQQNIQDAYEQRALEEVSKPEYHQDLLRKGVIDRDEFLDRLKTLGYDVDADDKPVPVAPKAAPPEVFRTPAAPPAPTPAPAAPETNLPPPA